MSSGDRLDVKALTEVLLPEASRLSAVICVMMDWDDERLKFVERLKSEGLSIRVVCMKQGCKLEGLDASEIIEAYE